MAEPELEISLARNLEDLQAVIALRAVVFMGGQDCPYAEEYDGNDLAGSSHLLARIDGQPAGSLRLRWFADFAKVERAAVLPRYRSAGIMRRLMDYALEHCRRRGYCKVLGHSQMHMIGYYGTFGFQVRKNRKRFQFSDHEYVEIELKLPPSNNAITAETAPLVLLRPEGEWDKPGVLDKSASRPAYNPNTLHPGGHAE